MKTENRTIAPNMTRMIITLPLSLIKEIDAIARENLETKSGTIRRICSEFCKQNRSNDDGNA